MGVIIHIPHAGSHGLTAMSRASRGVAPALHLTCNDSLTTMERKIPLHTLTFIATSIRYKTANNNSK